MEVFLTTYPCFTTSDEVLTALKHCIDLYKEKTPEPSSCLPVRREREERERGESERGRERERVSE